MCPVFSTNETSACKRAQRKSVHRQVMKCCDFNCLEALGLMKSLESWDFSSGRCDRVRNVVLRLSSAGQRDSKKARTTAWQLSFLPCNLEDCKHAGPFVGWEEVGRKSMSPQAALVILVEIFREWISSRTSQRPNISCMYHSVPQRPLEAWEF